MESSRLDNEMCCENWPRIAAYFSWFRMVDDPAMYCLPHIELPDGTKIKVNHCPICGGSLIGIFMRGVRD